MPTVSITKITPADTTVTVDWQSDTTVINSAQFMIATSQANLQAGTYVAVGDDSGNCPSMTFQATSPSGTPYLTPGTQYFIQAVCDGTTSQPSSFSTVADNDSLTQPKCDPWLIKMGANSTVSVVVMNGSTPAGNIPVTFTAPGDAGSLNGKPAGTPVTVNSDNSGKAQVTLTAGKKFGIFFILVSAAPKCSNVLHVPIVIY